jgi:hypothetical protein
MPAGGLSLDRRVRVVTLVSACAIGKNESVAMHFDFLSDWARIDSILAIIWSISLP